MRVLRKEKSKRDQKAKRKQDETHLVVRQTVLRQLIFGIALLSMLVGGWYCAAEIVAYVRANVDRSQQLTVAGVFIPIVWIWATICWTFYDRVFAKIVVTSKGLEFQVAGKRGFARWGALERFGHRRIYGRQTWGIILDRQLSLTGSRFDFLLAFDQDPQYLQTFIPLSWIVPVKKTGLLHRDVDLGHFRATPLGQEIAHNASRVYMKSRPKGR